MAEAAEALGHYAPPPMRMQVLAQGGGDDPERRLQRRAGVDAERAGNAERTLLESSKIAFLGDMKELGDSAQPRAPGAGGDHRRNSAAWMPFTRSARWPRRFPALFPLFPVQRRGPPRSPPTAWPCSRATSFL